MSIADDARQPRHQVEIGGRQAAGRLGGPVAHGDDDVGEAGGGVRLEQLAADPGFVERSRGGDARLERPKRGRKEPRLVQKPPSAAVEVGIPLELRRHVPLERVDCPLLAVERVEEGQHLGDQAGA